MIRRNVVISLILGAFIFAGFGCNNNVPTDGGIFKSADSGDSWTQKSKIDDDSGLTSASILDIKIDQQDSKKLIIGTFGLGVYVSTDEGEIWNTTDLSFGTIYSLSINPEDSMVVYAAGDVSEVGKIYKSLDGGLSWEEIFSETQSSTTINTIEVDWFDPRIIYAGTSNGAVLKSKDSGRSWVAIKFLEESVNNVLVSLKDSRTILASSGNEVFKSTNAGESWFSLEKALDKFEIRGDIHDMASHKSFKEIIYMSSSIGLLKTEDIGTTWTTVRLLTLPSSRTISKIALDELNPNIVYIGFDTNVYKSEDEGKNWAVNQFTTGEIGSLTVDTREDSSSVYVGVIYDN